MKFSLEQSRHLSAEELRHYVGAGLIEGVDSQVFECYMSNAVEELKEEKEFYAAECEWLEKRLKELEDDIQILRDQNTALQDIKCKTR